MGFKDGVETLSSDGKRRRDVLPGLSGRNRELVNYFAIYPNFLLTLHPDYMMTMTIWPQNRGRTRLVGEWHFHPDEIAKPDFVFEDAVEFWDRTNREDWAISEQSHLGITSRGYQPGPYSARETQLWEFDRFVSRVTGTGRSRESLDPAPNSFLEFSLSHSPYSSGRRCFKNSRRALTFPPASRESISA